MNPMMLLSLLLRFRWTSSTTVVPLPFSLLLFCLVGPALGALPQRDECEPKNCGIGPDVKYPFWLRDKHPPGCGFPIFELTCKNKSLVLEIESDDFVVRDIFYKNQSLITSNPRFSGTGWLYPLQNLSFGRAPFAISSVNRELFFFLNCTGAVPNSSEILCAESEGKRGRYFVGDHRTPYQGNISEKCESVVVERFAGYPIGYSGNYRDLLRNGFLLNWTAPNCSDCLDSGGRCRYDNQAERFGCLCSDRLHAVKCSGHVNIKRKIAIAVGASAAGFILASVFCYLWFRRKKRKEQSGSSAFLRSTSSELSMKKDLESASIHYQTHIFSYKELEEATNGFDSSEELGDGGFGTVYKGKLRDGRTVAVKRLYENNYRRVEQFMNEIGILNRLHHQNLVTLYGCTSRHSRELLLVYEYVSNGTVADHLHGGRASEGALTWPVRMSIAIETATALAYLHAVEPQIIHRDVKTNNILLDANFIVKVADFGLSRLFPVDVTHVSTAPQGTPGYVDPEYHQCYQLTEKSDVYSFGVVLVELISSKPAVDITRHRQEINLSNMAINKIQNGALHELVDPGLGFESDSEVKRMITLLAELAFRCLQGEKEMRPSMEEVLEVLKGIEDVDYKVEKPEDVEATPKDETRLLKNVMPASPDSVTVKWSSRSTTPNTSV